MNGMTTGGGTWRTGRIRGVEGGRMSRMGSMGREERRRETAAGVVLREGRSTVCWERTGMERTGGGRGGSGRKA